MDTLTADGDKITPVTRAGIVSGDSTIRGRGSYFLARGFLRKGRRFTPSSCDPDSMTSLN